MQLVIHISDLLVIFHLDSLIHNLCVYLNSKRSSETYGDGAKKSIHDVLKIGKQKKGKKLIGLKLM